MFRRDAPRVLTLTPIQSNTGRTFLRNQGVQTVDQAQDIGDILGIDFLLEIGICPDGVDGDSRLYSDELIEGGLEAMWQLLE